MISAKMQQHSDIGTGSNALMPKCNPFLSQPQTCPVPCALCATHRPGGRDGEGEGPVALANMAMKAAALYDLGLNYLVRARLLCSDAGDGSGLLPQEMYEKLPDVADLAR